MSPEAAPRRSRAQSPHSRLLVTTQPCQLRLRRVQKRGGRRGSSSATWGDERREALGSWCAVTWQCPRCRYCGPPESAGLGRRPADGGEALGRWVAGRTDAGGRRARGRETRRRLREDGGRRRGRRNAERRATRAACTPVRSRARLLGLQALPV